MKRRNPIACGVCRGDIAIIFLAILAGCGKGQDKHTRSTDDSSNQAVASLDGVYRTSKATQEAVLAGVDKHTFTTLRTKLATELSKAESAAIRAPSRSESQKIVEHIENYRTVLRAFEMYGEAWDFHDSYWNNCIKKGRSPAVCVDRFRSQGSELIAEAANAGLSIFPFERDPMQTVWTMASQYQGKAEARFLVERPQLQQ